MRRITILFTALLLALATMTGSALAMQPPAEPAQHLFGCPDPISGHPGAVGKDGGIVHATFLDATGDDMPTAWNAVQHADPIDLGECG